MENSKIKYYEEIQDLLNKIEEIKRQKKCFVPGDSVYYCPFMITGKAKFDENKILDFIVRDSGVDFHIYDDLSYGVVGEEQIFEHRGEAMKKYNKNLSSVLSILVKEKLLTEKDRVLFGSSIEPINGIYIDDNVRKTIIMTIIDHGNTDETVDILYKKLSV